MTETVTTSVCHDRGIDYCAMREYIDTLCAKYDFLDCGYLGESILGRPIPLIRLGIGQAHFLYVGTHHGAEWITGIILLRFVSEYCSLLATGKRAYNLELPYLFGAASIYVVPVLNPDGAEIAVKGNTDDLLSERRLRMNNGDTDFSNWQANARGVDLNHNYDCGFYEYKRLEAEAGILSGAPTRFSGLYPESENETSALCRFIRYQNIRMLLTLHTQGEEIFSGDCENIPRAKAIGKVIEKITGYKMSSAEGAAAYGGLTDWFTKTYSRPAYTIECGRGKNPLPISDLDSIYEKLRKLFFVFPIIK